ncbi:LacI family DNA-binding transcriptional regulator [Ligilactobacillus agilis]|uniref:LacI family DNA-binding transcriptional regulator n=1 Tax=Ligilactobacillus agilis TaxID=1601 RepID=UPI003F8AB383
MATMKDVAKLAGVSVGTVSRYINNAEGLKENTKQAVEQAIKELNYIPNEYAKWLKMKTTQTVVLLIPSVWNPFFSEFAYHVEQTLSANNYKMILCNSGHDTSRELEYIKMVVQNKVDGIIGITYNNIDDYISKQLPFVSIDRYFNQKTSYVTTENYQGGRLAATKLLAKGASKLAYIGDYNEYPNDTVNRRLGFKERVREASVPYHEIFEHEPLLDLERRVNELINMGVDGIFCVTDTMVLKVLEILKSKQVKVPEEIQLIGYDGMNLSENQPLGISTIVQPIELMAQEAVEIILKKISNPKLGPVVKSLPVTYREGWTTKN